MYQNYIFDLYGTLVDIRTNETSPYLWRKMSEFYSALGAVYSAGELRREYTRLVEQSCSGEYSEPDLTEVFLNLFLQKGCVCDRKQATLTAIMFRTISRSKLGLYDGVTELLDKLKKRGKKLYLLSNAQTDFTGPELDMLRLSCYFDGIFISSEERVKKPSSELYRRLMDRYGLEPKDCVMIGNDAVADIAGARAVGMDCLYIHTSISPQLSETVEADYLVMDGDFRKVEGLILRDIEAD